ncbi:MAG TPA: hypothetical protein DCZ95_17615, partial [Verrucomicrobia bacterium]|nr:hypothetical protein [Verrucomicrobiota bacterium]
ALEELKITHIKKVTNSLQLEISYPSSYSGSVWSAYSYDMPACVYTNGGSGDGGGFEPPTNEAPCEGCSTCYTDPEKSFAGLNRVWALAASNLVLTGETSTVWLDARPLGLDTNNEPCHRIYSLGANAVDEDNDGLNSAAELFVHKTNPTLSDTDLDGALDGAEVEAGTNPLNHPGDSDEDGLSDDLETVLGSDPDSADTDLDWFSDGFEEAKGFDPLSSSNTPPLLLEIDRHALYTRTTNILVSFPGFVAEHASIGETEDFTNGIVQDLAVGLPYGLKDESNGTRQVYARLYRNTVEQSPAIAGSIIFDNMAPLIGDFSPSNGVPTNRRWIMVTGAATDAVSAVRVFVDGNWSDGISEGRFQYDRYMLEAGTNRVQVTAEDMAGNVATQFLDVVQDTTGDVTAPSITLDLPRDYEIVGEVTNWFNQTTFGTNDLLYLKGLTDDETADVRFMVYAQDQTNGPFSAVVTATQVWGTVHLFPGSNTLQALASDAAGNTSTNAYTIVRDTNFFFEITSPASYQVVSGSSIPVSGIASPQFLNAAITVNGVGTTITNQGSHVAFATVSPVPLSSSCTYLQAEARLNGRSYYADPPVYGYEILHWKKRTCFADEHHEFMAPHHYLEYHHTVTGTSSYEWDSDSRVRTREEESVGASSFINRGSTQVYKQAWNTYTSSSVYAETITPSFWIGQNREDYQWAALPHHYSGYSQENYDSEIQFIKHWPTQETQWVVFQFRGLGIWSWNYSPSVLPEEITYRGQKGFRHNGNVSFVLPIRTEVEYSISASDFTWTETFFSGPSLWWGWDDTFASVVERGHLLVASGFSNSVLKVQLESDKAYSGSFMVDAGDEFSPAVTIDLINPQEFKVGKCDAVEPCNPESKDNALVIFRDTVAGTGGGIQPFSVTLKVDPNGLPNVQWLVINNPGSGTLEDADQAVATFRDPEIGGVYEWDAVVDGKVTTRTTLNLPLAGADMANWLDMEVRSMKTWALSHKAATEDANDSPIPGLTQYRVYQTWCNLSASDFDYRLNPVDAGHRAPCERFNPSSVLYTYVTVNGVVVHGSKINNMLWSLFGRYWGWPELSLRVGAHLNQLARDRRLDGTASQNAIGLGDDLYALIESSPGSSIYTVLTASGLQTMWDPAVLNEEKLWPSPYPYNSGSSTLLRPSLSTTP